MVRAMVTLRLTATAILGVALLLSSAHADDAAVADAIARVRGERAALRYRDALAAVDAALALGRASPIQLVELYRTAGELAGGLDEPTSAQRWFARWLALVPAGRLPAGASPKLRAPLDAARAELAGRSLALTVTDSANGTVTIAIDGDVIGMVRAVRIRSTDGSGVTQQGLPGAPMTLPSPAAGTALVAAALDEHDNELLVRPIPPALATRRGGFAAGDLPLYARWHPWAAGAVALTATGGGFAWRAGVAQDEFDRLRADSITHTFAELETVRRRGERHALVANLAFGAAAATAVVAVVLAVRGGSAPEAARVVIGPTLAPDHAGVALAGWF